ncbi:MAG: methyltransferase domain-containing protein [Alphaproteobacteria bacterium]|nr:methyltransferase domain-containing protein [Alphaproteobacteria bacterium]
MPSTHHLPPSNPMNVFDRRLLQARRRRTQAGFASYDFLRRAACEDIVSRLSAVNRTFTRVLEIGARDDALSRALGKSEELRGRIGDIYGCDISEACVTAPLGTAADEEALPFGDGSFDLVVSAVCLHWVNDLPGTLIQIRRCLKPDGLFVGILPGGRTLHELRSALLSAEEEIRGGAGSRVSPTLDVIDGAGLLQRAGFAMPVSDLDRITVRYGEPMRLLLDLRGMGETAAFANRSAPPLTRQILLRAMDIYKERFSDADGRVRATFDMIAMSGWAPAPDQPKPKRPGSASVRLADALGVSERSAGEQTSPRPERIQDVPTAQGRDHSK